MTITAKVIKDSVSHDGVRITTMQLRYPRFIHAEFMTHRVFSRNASSSRAVPFNRMVQNIQNCIAQPENWGTNKPGMQAGAELEGVDLMCAKMKWNEAAASAIDFAFQLDEQGLHKQIVNRVLEPFSHIDVVVTSTKWANFFALRDHPDAQPEMRRLAMEMRAVMEDSKPVLLDAGEWHLPYLVDTPDNLRAGLSAMVRWEDHGLPGAWAVLPAISAARCARVSYLTHDGKEPNIEEDIALFKRLAGSVPIHASPLEHQATPDRLWNRDGGVRWGRQTQHGNLHGWRQFRKMLPGESVED